MVQTPEPLIQRFYVEQVLEKFKISQNYKDISRNTVSLLCFSWRVWRSAWERSIRTAQKTRSADSQSTHRMAMATSFWHTFHRDGKISPAWWGWGMHAHPLSLYLPSRTMLQCRYQCTVCFSWEGRYPQTRPISTLPIYVLWELIYGTGTFLFFNTQYWVAMVWGWVIRYDILFTNIAYISPLFISNLWLTTDREASVVNLLSLKLFVRGCRSNFRK